LKGQGKAENTKQQEAGKITKVNDNCTFREHQLIATFFQISHC